MRIPTTSASRWSLFVAGLLASCCLSVPTWAATALTQVPVPPPAMGWSSWNAFGNGISEQVISRQADALVAFDATFANGTPKYTRINIDGGWWMQANGRDPSGAPVMDRSLWTNGSFASVVSYIHSKGLLAGAYTDIGMTGCGGQGGSEGYYVPDMMRFGQAGFDYVKVDFCGGRAEGLDPQAYYTSFAEAVKAAEVRWGRSIYFSLCDWGYYGPAGFPDAGKGPWAWAPGIDGVTGNSWRTGDDITFSVGPNARVQFDDLILNFHANNHPEAQHTGYYNDPDLMLIGMNGLDQDSSYTQSKAHMSLWAVSGAPLLMGIDIDKVNQTPALAAVLSNSAAIAVDQDARGLPPLQVALQANGLEVWSRLLSGSGRRAVVLLNTNSTAAPITVTAAQLGYRSGTPFKTQDVWTGATGTTKTDSYTATVPAEGAVMIVTAGIDLAVGSRAPTVAQNGSLTASLPGTTVSGAAPVNEGPTPLDLAYTNSANKTVFAKVTINGSSDSTTVAFPPTGSLPAGTVSVMSNLHKGQQNAVVFTSFDGSSPVPGIQAVSVAAGPVPAFQAAIQADAPGNTLAGGANVAPCSTCSDGHKVGYVGKTGMLTFAKVKAPAPGQYKILIAYLNGDGQARSANVSVNGAAGQSFNFPRGKDWNTVLVAPITVTLAQGDNTLTFLNPAGYAPDFSAIGAPMRVTQ